MNNHMQEGITLKDLKQWHHIKHKATTVQLLAISREIEHEIIKRTKQ